MYFWTTLCLMKGGESLDPILFSLRSGKQSTLPNHRYRVRYHIGLRWLAFAVWFISSSKDVYYDEGNSHLFSISACLHGPLLLTMIQRKPNPSTSTIYFVVSLSLDHMVITSFYCVWPGISFGALSTFCNQFLVAVSSLNSFNFGKLYLLVTYFFDSGYFSGLALSTMTSDWFFRWISTNLLGNFDLFVTPQFGSVVSLWHVNLARSLTSCAP